MAPQSQSCSTNKAGKPDLPHSDSDFEGDLTWVRTLAQQVHRHLPRWVPLEDIVSAGVIGLLAALSSFDVSRGVDFRCYARTRVRGAILDSLRETDWAPRSLRRKAREMNRCFDQLSGSLGRSPSESELAAALGMTLRQFQLLRRDLDGLEVCSLDEPHANHAWDKPLRDCVVDPRENNAYEQCLSAELRSLLECAMANMPESARRVLIHYYFDEMTMKEVGALLGIGESRVSQIHGSAISLLRERLLQSLAAPLPPAHPDSAIAPYRTALPAFAAHDHDQLSQ